MCLWKSQLATHLKPPCIPSPRARTLATMSRPLRTRVRLYANVPDDHAPWDVRRDVPKSGMRQVVRQINEAASAKRPLHTTHAHIGVFPMGEIVGAEWVGNSVEADIEFPRVTTPHDRALLRAELKKVLVDVSLTTDAYACEPSADNPTGYEWKVVEVAHTTKGAREGTHVLRVEGSLAASSTAASDGATRVVHRDGEAVMSITEDAASDSATEAAAPVATVAETSAASSSSGVAPMEDVAPMNNGGTNNPPSISEPATTQPAPDTAGALAPTVATSPPTPPPPPPPPPPAVMASPDPAAAAAAAAASSSSSSSSSSSTPAASSVGSVAGAPSATASAESIAKEFEGAIAHLMGVTVPGQNKSVNDLVKEAGLPEEASAKVIRDARGRFLSAAQALQAMQGVPPEAAQLASEALVQQGYAATKQSIAAYHETQQLVEALAQRDQQRGVEVTPEKSAGRFERFIRDAEARRDAAELVGLVSAQGQQPPVQPPPQQQQQIQQQQIQQQQQQAQQQPPPRPMASALSMMMQGASPFTAAVSAQTGNVARNAASSSSSSSSSSSVPSYSSSSSSSSAPSYGYVQAQGVAMGQQVSVRMGGVPITVEASEQAAELLRSSESAQQPLQSLLPPGFDKTGQDPRALQFAFGSNDNDDAMTELARTEALTNIVLHQFQNRLVGAAPDLKSYLSPDGMPGVAQVVVRASRGHA